MIYHTNFDYELALEASLKNKTYTPNKRMNNEFSYLFLWCESKFNKVLLSDIDFGPGYIDSISKTLGFEVKTSWTKKSSEKIGNWWGKLENIPLELKLNSKVYHQKLLKTVKPKHFIHGIVCSKGEFISSGDYFFRSEYGFAGMGSFRFKNKSFIPRAGVVTPFLSKKLDLSCFYNNGETKIYINEISKMNSFYGCKVFKNDDFLTEELRRRGIDDSTVKESFQEVIEVILGKYPELKKFQIDGIYTDDNQCLINEINYRKSMGQIALKLLEYFPDKSSLKFSLIPKKNFKFKSNMSVMTPKNSYEYQFITSISF